MGINLREVEKRAVSDAHNRTSEITQTIGTYVVRHIRGDAVGDVLMSIIRPPLPKVSMHDFHFILK